MSQSSAAPFYPSGLQWVKNAQKVEIENRPWPYFFSQLDPMLFRVFSLKLTKETPCGHQQVNSKIFIFCLITTPRYWSICTVCRYFFSEWVLMWFLSWGYQRCCMSIRTVCSQEIFLRNVAICVSWGNWQHVCKQMVSLLCGFACVFWGLHEPWTMNQVAYMIDLKIDLAAFVGFSSTVWKWINFNLPLKLA